MDKERLIWVEARAECQSWILLHGQHVVEYIGGGVISRRLAPFTTILDHVVHVKMALPRLSLASLVFARGCDDLCIEARKRLWWKPCRRWRTILVGFNILALARKKLIYVEGKGQEELVELVTA